MPELPEVEVVRRGLQTQLAGRSLRSIVVRERRLRWPIEPALEQHLAGQVIRSVGRRGKYLLLTVETGTLISHLGMSGSWRLVDPREPARAHDHVDLVFDHGVVRYHDPRRFGSLHWHALEAGPLASHVLLASLGIEPLSADFDGALLYAQSRRRALSIKQFLLAGHAVVGVGNIYASESLFRAGIRPTIAAGRVSRKRYDRLAAEIRATLSVAIERGGSSLRDFVGSDGQQGYFQSQALVYARAGQPCMQCATPIRLIRQQQRASFYCPVCQR
jgi:formamidopyrimidine-DNA glycosylase